MDKFIILGGLQMRNIKTITEEEKIKCKKVAEAFTEVYESYDEMAVVDAGRFGFVLCNEYLENHLFT